MNRYPSYCCQKCGDTIGWLGRFFNALLPGWHKCPPTERDPNNWGI